MSKRWILATCLTGTLVPAVFAMAACSSSGTMPAATTVPASATDTATPTATATPSPTPSPAPTPTPVLSDLQKAAQTLIVTATTSRVLPVDYNAYRFSARFEADFTFQNTGTKGIHAFSGILIISDLFGTPIKQSRASSRSQTNLFLRGGQSRTRDLASISTSSWMRTTRWRPRPSPT
jgi:hypothetical protein